MAKVYSSKAVEFEFYAPAAKKVALAGSFNDWNLKGKAAKKDAQGVWKVKLNLKPGRYEYKFLADGSWIEGCNGNMCTQNSYGTQNCVVEI